MSAQQLIAKLNLQPHPEGGYYRRTYLQAQEQASCIYYMLECGDKSHWHTIQSDEILLFHCGQPLTVHVIIDKQLHTYTLGSNILNGELAQLVIPANSVLAMTGSTTDQPLDYTLISCVVSPQFKFEEFKLYSQQEMLARYPQLDKGLLVNFSME